MKPPQTITLTDVAQGSPPVDVTAVLTDVLFKLIDNPVNALLPAVRIQRRIITVPFQPFHHLIAAGPSKNDNFQ